MKRLLLSKKTSKILSLALAIALLALYVPATITASAMSGSGTAGSPYIIRTLADLQEVDNDLDAHYRLGANINISGWYIGSPSDEFTGNFDGNGYTLSGINGFALFAATEDATIRNLTITGSYASNDRSAGALINTAKGTLTLSNVVSHVNLVEGSFHNVGGLVGEADEVTISDCVVTGRVEGDNNNVGGLVGLINDTGTITRSYTTGNITGGQNTGGIAARFAGEISQCFSTGNIYGVSYVGGIVGDLHTHSSNISRINRKSTVMDCYASGDITAGDYTGGIVGSMYDGINSVTVSRCYFSGDVSGDVRTGGIAGYLSASNGAVRNCYALSNYIFSNRSNGWARVAYATNNDYPLLVSSNYALNTMTTPQQPSPTGTNTIHGGNISFADAQIESSYSGWDFSNVWVLDSRYDYPRLRNLGGYSSIEVEPASLVMYEDDTAYATATVYVASDQLVSCVSSDLAVANGSFEPTGTPGEYEVTVTSGMAGNAVLTLRTAQGFKTECKVTVNFYPPDAIRFSPSPQSSDYLEAVVNNYVQVTVILDDAAGRVKNKVVTLSSSDPSVTSIVQSPSNPLVYRVTFNTADIYVTLTATHESGASANLDFYVAGDIWR